jgi:hypothetical protein
MASGRPAVTAADLDVLAALLDERLAGVQLTPGERAEALCIALGVDPALSAAARGISPQTVRASRRRLREKLERAVAHPRAPSAPGPEAASSRSVS